MWDCHHYSNTTFVKVKFGGGKVLKLDKQFKYNIC